MNYDKIKVMCMYMHCQLNLNNPIAQERFTEISYMLQISIFIKYYKASQIFLTRYKASQQFLVLLHPEIIKVSQMLDYPKRSRHTNVLSFIMNNEIASMEISNTVVP